ncbi:TetR/AcrR family transcriptional regulator [Streptomyces sp. B-S-A8]|uniref:TetR/AcrR family transcriptional regulator n=1 Tax=Streptomyces solicavernae TaxID=3043614 RepID=A0ABT6RW29_9ACTN|nr:TetR/AcrR family transcriptional regulator [Streptomyces sp. B-S-A8]MDI3388545.1 TetR/AcrR family transcriptional regulator [Streptomyces sp. B-S-A8]
MPSRNGAETAERDSDKPGASRLSRRRDRRKAEIVRTATELLSSYGYQGMSLEGVAERTDIAKATLYHYFASKDDLVSAALESLTEEVLTRLDARRRTVSDASATEQLRALVDEQILILTETAPEVATVFSWPKSWPELFDEPMKDMRRRHDAVFRTVAEEGLRRGEFNCSNINVALQCLHGILNQSSVWIRPGVVADHAALRRDVVDCALRLFV